MKEIIVRVCAITDFICPIDAKTLSRESACLRCENGHSYDVAREGYFNLLLVQQKKSIDPGDNKEMVAARSRFLNNGYFSPIAQKIFKIVSTISSGNSLRIIDAGCGDGYYLTKLREDALASSDSRTLYLAGVDISKWAIKAAAKRSKEISWIVAGNKQLPFSPGQIDIILSMFGFPIWKSFSAVQPKGGYVLLLDPGPNHLVELRKIIYPTITPSEAPSLIEAKANGYELEQKSSLEFPIELKNKSEINDLLMMTPHGFRISEKGRNNLSRIDHLTMTVEVVFQVLRKNKNF